MATNFKIVKENVQVKCSVPAASVHRLSICDFYLKLIGEYRIIYFPQCLWNHSRKERGLQAPEG